MPKVNDAALEVLLDLNGLSFRLDKGYWVKFEAWLVKPNLQIPHGVRYTLTLHNHNNARVIGFDNAHDCQPARRKKYAGRRVVWDHYHRSEGTAVPYEFDSAAQLVEDFRSEVEKIVPGDLT
jgi:hypothetical protein